MCLIHILLITIAKKRYEFNQKNLKMESTIEVFSQKFKLSRHYRKLLEWFPCFKLDKASLDRIPLFVELCSQSQASYFIIAFVAMYNFGFNNCPKTGKFSIKHVSSSILASLLQDICIMDILKIGKTILNLLFELESETNQILWEQNILKNKDKSVLFQLAYETAVKLFQILSSACKSKELDFWLQAGCNPEVVKYGILGTNIRELILKFRKNKPTLKTLKSVITPRYQWIYSIGKACQKVIPECLVLIEYIKYFTFNDNFPKLETTLSEPIYSNLPDFISFDKIITKHVYHQESTGISDINGIPLTCSICKSILQKSIRVGRPIINIEDFNNFKFKLGNVCNISIPLHYINNIHVSKNRHLDSIEDTTFEQYFKSGIRSFNSIDVFLDSNTTLYNFIWKTNLKIMDLGFKPNFDLLLGITPLE